MNLKEEKKLIRKEILSIRDELFLDKDLYFKYSKSIIDKLMNTKIYKESKNIMCFVSFKSEVFTHDFIKESLKLGKNIYVPIIDKKTNTMHASKIEDFSDLKEGYYGILSPTEEKINIIDPNALDLIIVPGVAFTKDGYRIGYGGGYYDKFFSLLKKDVEKIAICFNLQFREQLPIEEFDYKIPNIITESNIYYK